MKCKNCKSKELKKIIYLNKQPISSVFLKKPNFELKKYSLDLLECQNCKLVQFNKLPPLDDMYGETYGYRTSLSPLMVNHMKKKFKTILDKKIINNNSLILDIGSNDGTFLNFFAKKNQYKLYGIDPSSAKFKKFYNKKINLISDYFSKKIIEKYLNNKKTKFDLITSYAMFYDIEEPNLFCKDINDLLSKNGIWILEMSYFPLLLKNLTYDQICHEHVTYYTLTSFEKIISKHNLKIVDFSFNEINGGSIEIICVKKQNKIKIQKEKIKKIKEEELKINFNSYKKFNDRMNNTKNVLNNFLDNIKSKDIIGYGASTKGNIVLNHCNLNSKKLNYICDANPYKFNRFTPGSNIKIISKNEMRKRNPKYLLVLIWSFRSEVIKQEIKFILKGGKLIFHLPIFHIIDKNNYKDFLKKSFDSFSFNV